MTLATPPKETTTMATYQVWYTKKNGDEMMAWQGLTYTQAWQKVTEMAAMGYDASVVTPAT
jgi:hypothetical protein